VLRDDRGVFLILTPPFFTPSSPPVSGASVCRWGGAVCKSPSFLESQECSLSSLPLSFLSSSTQNTVITVPPSGPGSLSPPVCRTDGQAGAQQAAGMMENSLSWTKRSPAFRNVYLKKVSEFRGSTVLVPGVRVTAGWKERTPEDSVMGFEPHWGCRNHVLLSLCRSAAVSAC
jgi:hypothetical protein